MNLYLRVGEPKIYDKVKQVKLSATFVATFDLPSIMAPGFFVAVPDSNWQKWKASLAKVLFNARQTKGKEQLIQRPIAEGSGDVHLFVNAYRAKLCLSTFVLRIRYSLPRRLLRGRTLGGFQTVWPPLSKRQEERSSHQMP